MIAALFVEKDGIYFGRCDVDPWDKDRDARCYPGPYPVVAHPPCARWSKLWFGSPLNPVRKKGDDGGCFAAALAAVRAYGGVLEHPAYSHAWRAHGLPWPPVEGWQRDIHGGWCCYVDQHWYGHWTTKPTWLYAVKTSLPSLRWGKAIVPIDPTRIEKYGRARASRLGNLSLHGGGTHTAARSQTPAAFVDLLLAMAASVEPQ